MKTHEVCQNCKGLGFLNKDELIEIPDMCPDCFGKGKLDWIEKIIGAKKPWGFNTLSGNYHRATLNNIRENIEDIIENSMFKLKDPSQNNYQIYYRIQSFLNMCKSKGQIYQWQVNMISDDELLLHPDEENEDPVGKLDINIQINKTIRFINMTIKVE